MQSIALIALMVAAQAGAAPGAQVPPPQTTVQTPASGPGVVSTLSRIERSPDGHVVALVLENGTRVRIAPGAEIALQPILHEGDRLRVEGDRSTEGEVTWLVPTRVTNLTTNEAIVLAAAPAAPKAPEVQVPPGTTKVAIKGRLKEFWAGARGEADGLYLIEGTEVILPASFGPNVRRAVSIGEPVRIVGFYTTNDYGRRQFRALSVTNEKTHQTIQLPATASMGGGAGKGAPAPEAPEAP